MCNRFEGVDQFKFLKIGRSLQQRQDVEKWGQLLQFLYVVFQIIIYLPILLRVANIQESKICTSFMKDFGDSLMSISHLGKYNCLRRLCRRKGKGIETYIYFTATIQIFYSVQYSRSMSLHHALRKKILLITGLNPSSLIIGIWVFN